jgi:hypothetical protein
MQQGWDMRSWPGGCSGISDRACQALSLSKSVVDNMITSRFDNINRMGDYSSQFLRYCPMCIEQGFHTALFQHPPASE